MHSILWGAFQVTDLQITENGIGSSIDFVYGSSRSEFAGCHRFTVRKECGNQGYAKEVFVSMECITCNPKEDKPFSGQFLSDVHKKYATMLFREAVGEMKSLLH